MLELFRRYQRFLFIFVTVIIIVTFSLFGSYKTFGSAEGRKEIVVGHAIDGSKLKYFEIKQLSTLLGAESGQSGVIGKEFLKTGVAEWLALAFSDQLKVDWQSRLDCSKRCRFYVHPAAPSLNVQEIWNQMAPGAMEELHALQSMTEPTSDFFAAWTRLFWLQEQCPAELIKRILFYHQNQYQIPQDPHLFNEDFSLLGLRGVGEWYGHSFADLVSQFILNGAIMAEEKGYHATRAEAEADLIRRFSSKEHSLDLVLHSLGIQKRDAIQIWQRVILYLNYFQTVGQATLLDDLAYRHFSDYAHETAQIDLYQLPSDLQMKSVDDFLSFEIYKRLACAPSDLLSLPQSLLSADLVEKRAPELVYTKYRLKCAQIDLKTIQSRLSMREVWSWQMVPLHWEALKQAFPEISTEAGKNPFQILEKLDSVRRAVVDDWSRQQIVEAHPEWIEQELSAAQVKDSEVMIFANGDIDGLSIEQVSDFQPLLEGFLAGDLAALESLKAYREKSSIWRISEINLVSKQAVISFADAKKKERIKVDHFLDEEYYLVRNQMPSLYQNESGEFRPLSEVQETLILQIFAPLFRAIDREISGHENSLAFYIQHRFDPMMRRGLASLQAGKEPDDADSLWKIEQCERTITKTSSEEWMMKQPFILNTNQWSDVYVPSNGEIVFFFVKDRAVVPTPVLEQIQQGKQTLSGDVQCLLADQLLALALKKQAIILPLNIEQEKNDDL